MHNSTVLVGKHVRNATVLYLYLLVLFTRFGRAETHLLVLVRARRIMFEVKYGTMQYSRTSTRTVQAGEWPKYRTVQYGTGTVI